MLLQVQIRGDLETEELTVKELHDKKHPQLHCNFAHCRFFSDYHHSIYIYIYHCDITLVKKMCKLGNLYRKRQRLQYQLKQRYPHHFLLLTPF